MDIRKKNLLQIVDSFLRLLYTLICEGISVMVKAQYSMHVMSNSKLHDKENSLVLARLLDKLFNNAIKNVSWKQ